jgi:RNA polymerase sigma factor (sigma-70 family)
VQDKWYNKKDKRNKLTERIQKMIPKIPEIKNPEKYADFDLPREKLEYALREALKKLSQREIDIVERRFYKGRTQMEIAAEIGISQAQVSRIEKGAVEKLRKYME